MTRAASPSSKIPQRPRNRPPAMLSGAPGGRVPGARHRAGVLTSGTGRAATRGGGEVIELGHGITVYPAREDHARWRVVWQEDGKREQCEAASEEKLAAKLEKVTERLRADAPNMKRPGADLIAHYLDPDRLPVKDRWSRKHAHTQRRLCERFGAPVIDAVTCQDIKTEHMQRIVNAAPTAGEGARVQGVAAGRHGDRDELMANTAAYTGLRWGEPVDPQGERQDRHPHPVRRPACRLRFLVRQPPPPARAGRRARGPSPAIAEASLITPRLPRSPPPRTRMSAAEPAARCTG